MDIFHTQGYVISQDTNCYREKDSFDNRENPEEDCGSSAPK